MRRIPAILIILLLIVASVHSADNQTYRAWFENDPDKTQNTFDLESVLQVPQISQYVNDFQNYDKGNYIGTVGISNTGNHQMEIMVTTDGRFVSISDPTKYREYSVSICPTTSAQHEGSKTYYQNTQSQEILPNTKYHGNPLVFETPSLKGGTKVIWADLLLVLEELSAEDYKHIAEADDYTATINVEWACQTKNCSQHPGGSASLTIRGYFGGNGNMDSFAMIITPTPSATSINLLNLVNTGNSEKIGNIQLITSTKKTAQNAATYNWQQHLFVFASSSTQYNQTGEPFKLVNRKTGETIGYQVTIAKENGSGSTTFDGTKCYTNTLAPGYLDISGCTTTTQDRYFANYTMLNYAGEISISLLSSDIAAIRNARSIQGSTDGKAYSGVYSSSVYIHVVYE